MSTEYKFTVLGKKQYKGKNVTMVRCDVCQVTMQKGGIRSHQYYKHNIGTKNPIEKKDKKLDIEKTFKKITQYYVDKKGYTAEQANRIAQTEIQRQMQEKSSV